MQVPARPVSRTAKSAPADTCLFGCSRTTTVPGPFQHGRLRSTGITGRRSPRLASTLRWGWCRGHGRFERPPGGQSAAAQAQLPARPPGRGCLPSGVTSGIVPDPSCRLHPEHHRGAGGGLRCARAQIQCHWGFTCSLHDPGAPSQVLEDRYVTFGSHVRRSGYRRMPWVSVITPKDLHLPLPIRLGVSCVSVGVSWVSIGVMENGQPSLSARAFRNGVLPPPQSVNQKKFFSEHWKTTPMVQVPIYLRFWSSFGDVNLFVCIPHSRLKCLPEGP